MSSRSDPTNPNQRDSQMRPRKLPDPSLEGLLKEAESAARAGKRIEARRLFREVLARDPSSEDAWLWLAYLAPSPSQSLAYLQQARGYHPQSRRVREATAWAQGRLAQQDGAAASRVAAARPETDRPAAAGRLAEHGPAEPEVVRGPERRQAVPSFRPAGRPLARDRTPRRPKAALLAGLVLTGMALLTTILAIALSGPQRQAAGPGPRPTHTATVPSDMATLREQANLAISGQDWGRAIPLLEGMRRLSPEDDGVRQQLAVAHLRFGLQLVELDRLDEAIAHYDAAIRFYANDVDLQTARRLAIGYRDGRQAMAAGHWPEAAALLEPVFELAPDFRDVADLLYNTRLRQGAALESDRKLEEACRAYARAVEIRPESQEAQSKLARITAILTPPTPTPPPQPRKRIVVSLSNQRLSAYQDDELLYDWVCSTGEPARATQPGSFQVLDKIPEAWSSVWGLRMPYWLGIYWAGGSENGIHALPINMSGTQLWAGYLGHRVSFGCIILDTPNAATLYQWADIGTPVTVIP